MSALFVMWKKSYTRTLNHIIIKHTSGMPLTALQADVQLVVRGQQQHHIPPAYPPNTKLQTHNPHQHIMHQTRYYPITVVCQRLQCQQVMHCCRRVATGRWLSMCYRVCSHQCCVTPGDLGLQQHPYHLHTHPNQAANPQPMGSSNNTPFTPL